MAHNVGYVSEINLVNGPSKNNIMNYQSEVLIVGHKRFELKLTSKDNYLLLIAAQLRED